MVRYRVRGLVTGVQILAVPLFFSKTETFLNIKLLMSNIGVIIMDNSEIKIFGALAHIVGIGWAGIIGLVFSILLIVKGEKNRRAKLLGFQGLFWIIAVGVISLIFLPLYIYARPIWWIIQVLAFVASLFFAYKIYNGEKVEIPLISDLARKVAK